VPISLYDVFKKIINYDLGFMQSRTEGIETKFAPQFLE
jgi:hypothetical protein